MDLSWQEKPILGISKGPEKPTSSTSRFERAARVKKRIQTYTLSFLPIQGNFIIFSEQK
jgi:hypothetical protein